jgi:hypothetical protein
MGLFGRFEHWVGDRIGNGPSLNGLKSSIKGTAKLGGTIAPVVSAFNPLLGAGLSAAGGLARGKSIADIVKDAGISAGVGYGINHIGDLAGGVKGLFSDGAPGIGGDVAGAGAAAAPGTVSLGGISMPTPTAATIEPTVAQRVASSVEQSAAPAAKGFFSNLSAGDKLKAAQGAGSSLLGYVGQSQANAANRDRLKFEQQQYADQKKKDDEDRARKAEVSQALLAWMSQRFGQPGAVG